ncbi:HPP family protein [Pantanalinema sp. GBBB05]|uniref:HPP family protein n=1 Tax=Pantanalinema sp. GBBB05 TaxID=2604139 RepID=UPI001DA2E589|nr:HPP family protein [Pantanalinema sp. GBBB05]
MTSTKPSQRDRGSRTDHYPPGVPGIVWAPLAAALLMLIVGLLGLLAHQPWLFPSLGPTAFLQAEQPEQPTARFYNTVMGHLHGLIAGILAVLVLGASVASPVLSTGELTPVRVWAAVIAVALNMLLGLILKASHPPAAATTLLVALGGFKPTWRDASTIMIGVLIVAIVGELLRRLRTKGAIA